MSKLELIQILTKDTFPDDLRIQKMTIDELRKEAYAKNIPGVWKLRRAQLVELLYPSPQQNNKNDDGAQKHNDPQARKGEDVWVEV